MSISRISKNINVSTRLAIGFGIIIIFVLTGFVFVQNRMNLISESLIKLYDHPFTVSLEIDRAYIHVISMHRNMKDVALAENVSQIDEAVNRVKENEILVLNSLNIAKEKYLGDTKDIEKLIQDFRQWKIIREKVIELTKNGKNRKAAEITKTEGAKHVDLLTGSFGNLMKFAKNKADEFKSKSVIRNNEAKIGIYIIMIFIVTIAILIAFVLTKSITAPLAHAIDIAKEIASRNLSVDLISSHRKDEIGKLISSFNKMINNLREQFKNIMEGVNILSTSNSEITTSISQLAASASETATSIGETTVTVEQVKQTAEVSNHKAKIVSENAFRATEISNEGKKAVANTIEGMKNIKKQMESIAGMVVHLSEQSQTIGDITDTVNELAEQSNLLAVNAAIEASKAGDQGKGFTVVAQEIRNLSERSKEATLQVRGVLKDIQKSISASVMATEEGGKAVEEGMNLTATSGDAINSLSDSVTESANAAIQIAASSQQQLEGMDQVVAAMETIKLASSQAASSTQQSADSVNELQKLSQKLKDIMNQYKITNE